MDLYLHGNCLSCEKTGPPRLVLVGLMVGRQTKDFKIFNILYSLNYLEFYFVDISAMLLIVLEVFSVCFSQTKCILGCVLWCVKFCRRFFISIRY